MIIYRYTYKTHNVTVTYDDYDSFVTAEGWRAHIHRDSISDLLSGIESSDPARRAEAEQELYWTWKQAKSAYDRA